MIKELPGMAPIPAEVVLEWEKIFATDADRPGGRSIYPEIFANGWLFPLQRMRETEKMIELARPLMPRVVVEIGSDKGGSFFHWIKCLPTVEKAIAIEIRGVPFAETFARAFPERDLLCIDESSYDPTTVASVERFLDGRKIDCLFIDGDKCGFDRDFDAYLPLMQRGRGIVFFHDIQDADNSTETFERLSRTYRHDQIIDTSEYDAIEEREAAGIPAAGSYEQWFRIWRRRSCGVGVIYV